MHKCIELLPCYWLISNLCYQAIEQVYPIKWLVSLCIYSSKWYFIGKKNFFTGYLSTTHLNFLRRLKRASLPPPILTTFYRGIIESVLTSCITVLYGNCGAADRKTLQWTVNTAAKIIRAPLPSILDIFLTHCSSKANSIVKEPTHPSHSLLQLLPSGRRYQSIRARSARLLNSFFPQAVRALNSNHHVPL